MSVEKKKYRFLFVEAFTLPSNSRFMPPRPGLSEGQRLMNYETIKHLLEDVEWDKHEGPLAS